MKIKVLLLTLFIFITFISCKKDNKANTNIETEQKQESIFQIEQGKHCYQYIISNSYKKDGKVINEKDYIDINFNIKDKDVDGTYVVTASDGKISEGHFVGSINNNIITTIHTYKNDKEILKDELVFKVDANKIAILGGEKKLINGVNMFIDKSKCDYMMDLTKINCN